MKKIASMLMMAVVLLALAACGGPSPKEVVEKYKAGDKLTEADYDVAFNYLKDAVKDVKGIMEKAKDDPMKAAEEIEKIDKKYEYANDMGKILSKAPEKYQEEKKKELLKALGMDESDLNGLLNGL